jgi:hypothetical protein
MAIFCKDTVEKSIMVVSKNYRLVVAERAQKYRIKNHPDRDKIKMLSTSFLLTGRRLTALLKISNIIFSG